MLSDREKKWLFWGGVTAFCLLYLWLVLFPLLGYHQKMRRRISRTWKNLRQLEKEVGNYAKLSGRVRDLILRAREANPKTPPEEQLRRLIRGSLGTKAAVPPLRCDAVWEGEGIVIEHCRLAFETTPAKALGLVQRIDHHYLPMRVVSWKLEGTKRNTYKMTLEVVFLKAEKRP